MIESSSQSPRAQSTPSYVFVILLAIVALFAWGLFLETTSEAVDAAGPAGLALDIDNGVPTPLHVKRGQAFYLEQIDLRASTTSTVDEDVEGLRTRGDFAGLAWANLTREENAFVLLPNADGTSTRRAFYRDAVWMRVRSMFRLEQVDAHGNRVGEPVIADAC